MQFVVAGWKALDLRKMSLIHIACVCLACMIGFLLGGILSRLLGFYEYRASIMLLLGMLCVLALPWSMMRAIGIWPIMRRCPNCRQIPAFECQVADKGLTLTCTLCRRSFTIKGPWSRSDSGEWTFRFPAKPDATVLGEDGEASFQVSPKWPYWILRWKRIRSSVEDGRQRTDTFR